MSDQMNEHQQQNAYEAYVHAEKITLNDIYSHMTGPVISIVLHVILIALLGTMIVYEPPQKKEELTIEVKNVEIKPLEKKPEPPTPPEEVMDDNVPIEVDRPTISNEVVATEVNNVNVESTDVSVAMPDTLSIKLNNSALKLPGVMAARTVSGRKDAMKKYAKGNVTKIDNAVSRALKWLAKVQNEDGSWGDNAAHAPAMTAMAVLTFLAHGDTPQDSPEHGETVLKGLRKLVEYVDTIKNGKGCIANGGNGYAHGMVAYAVSEGYAMTKTPMLERAMNKIILTIIDGQNSLGSYDYSLRKDTLTKADPATGKVAAGSIIGDPRCDLSVAGWNYQALKAAFAAGCSVPGLVESIDKSIESIETIHNGRNGTFTYGQSRGQATGSFTMTSVGTLCLQLMGAGNKTPAKDGVKWLCAYRAPGTKEGSELTMDWKTPPGGFALYGWYYMTQALFQGTNGTGKIWKLWDSSFSTTLTKEQDREGFWISPIDKYGKAHGGHAESGKPGPVDPKTGKEAPAMFTELNSKIWTTTMCTLMLEVYYRHLPSFKVSGHAEASTTAPKESKVDDLTL